MNPGERDRLAQEFVDKALARYGQAEPRAGLEARILARVADAEPAPAWWLQWKWAVMGAAVVVALTAGLGVYRMVHREIRPHARPVVRVNPTAPSPGTRAPEATPVQSAKHSPPPGRQRTRRNTERVERARGSPPATADSPRLAQFPAPAPLSEQERLLLSYLKGTPREEIVAVVKENEEFQRRLREAEEMRTPTQ